MDEGTAEFWKPLKQKKGAKPKQLDGFQTDQKLIENELMKADRNSDEEDLKDILGDPNDEDNQMQMEEFNMGHRGQNI